ncbi:hypothetical protein DBR06_SOUSAS2010007, partial [Sousa chinensis]
FQSGSQGCPPTFLVSLRVAMGVWLSPVPTPGDKASGARPWWSLDWLETNPDSQPAIELSDLPDDHHSQFPQSPEISPGRKGSGKSEG